MKRLFLAIQLICILLASSIAMAVNAPKTAPKAAQTTQVQTAKKAVKGKAVTKKSVKTATKAQLLAQATTTAAQAQAVNANAAAVPAVPPAADSKASASPSVNATIAQKTAVAPAKPVKKLSALVGLSRNNSLNNYQDGTEQASWDTTLMVGYKLDDAYTVSAIVERSDDIKDSEYSDWAGASVRASRKGIPVFNNSATVAPRLTIGLPISKAQKFASFQSSLGLSTRLAANPDRLFSKKLGLSTGLGITRSFHQYETAVSGSVNNQYSATLDVSSSWSFTDELALSIDVVHYNTWSYFGTMREFYSHSQELSYAVNEQFTVAMGHTIGRRNVWNSDSSNYEYKLIDERNSLVYGSLTYTY